MNRREFLAAATACAVASQCLAQASASVAEMERAHVLAEAATALARVGAGAPEDVAALTAAFVLTKDEQYAAAAVRCLRASTLGAEPAAHLRAADIVTYLPQAELARATSFLRESPFWKETDQRSLTAGLAGTNEWLRSKQGQLARDAKDHRASAWLLVSSAVAKALRDEKQLEENRASFKKPTLRVQIDSMGRFPQEAASTDPWRNTLFNFDLLCGCAQVLSTPFDDLWTFELIEGVGLRSAVAYLYPMLADVRRWPLPADSSLFRQVPLRRPGLLFAGRAYHRADYADLFRSLPIAIPSTELAYSLPIRQPVLWTTKAPHGL